jgi:hypothetical protein
MLFPPGIENLFASMLGHAVDEVADGSSDPLTRSILRWVGRVQSQILLRWRPLVQSGARCGIGQRMPDGEVVNCREAAIGSCGFCGLHTCLHHAMIDENANILCFRCLHEAARLMRARTEPNPPRVRPEPEAGEPRRPGIEGDERSERRRYLRVLGLRDPVTSTELDETFRELMRKHHPDRATENKRAAAEKRCKAITEAYHWIQNHQKKAA